MRPSRSRVTSENDADSTERRSIESIDADAKAVDTRRDERSSIVVTTTTTGWRKTLERLREFAESQDSPTRNRDRPNLLAHESVVRRPTKTSYEDFGFQFRSCRGRQRGRARGSRNGRASERAIAREGPPATARRRRSPVRRRARAGCLRNYG